MRKNLLIGILLLLFVLGTAAIVFSNNERKNKDELYRQVELFADTLAIIQKDYVSETTPKALIYGALKGMLSSLDPHSQFMDPESFEDLKLDTEGRYGGLGVEITIKDGLLTVITPIEDTPAWKAGLKANDRIVKINDELTRDMSLTDVVKKLRGKPGELIRLMVLRDSEKRLLEFKIVRAVIKIKDIKNVRILEDGIGYVRLVEFRENSLQEFNSALSSLAKQGMQALIIDLRNNPGGLLDVAVKITGRFIPADKLVVYTKGRQKDQNLEFFSDSKDFIQDLPLAVLINEGSASASEIVAGALQDYKRAIIIGTKSFGKGSVQTVIPLGDGSALRLTTSHYFTPSGKIIQDKGVIPDIAVEPEKKLPAKSSGISTKDPEEMFEELETPSLNNESLEGQFNYKTDPVLLRALDALKVVKLYKKTKE